MSSVSEPPHYTPYHTEWYLDFICEQNAKLSSDDLSLTRQRKLVRRLFFRFKQNEGDNNKRIIEGELLDEFFSQVERFTRMLELEALTRPISRVPEHFRRWMLFTRDQLDVEALGVEIDSIMCLDGRMLIHGIVSDPSFGPDQLLTASLSSPNGTKQIELHDPGFKKTFRYFGRELTSNRRFDLILPLEDLAFGTRISWQLDGTPEDSPIRFTSAASRFSLPHASTYAEFGDIAAVADETGLTVRKPSWSARFLQEARSFRYLARRRMPLQLKMLEGGLRIAWNLSRPFFSKRIIVYFDKLYMGGDNGQHLFEYASERAANDKSRAKHYYFVHGNTREYRELRSKGLRVVNFSSPLRKLYAINAYLICATHAGVPSYLGFNSFEKRWFAGVLKYHVVCIQHGLTVQDIPNLQARWRDNIERYFVASPVELANLRRPEYGYSEDQLRLTGIARFDGLDTGDEEQVVLVFPTWRRDLISRASRAGRARPYIETFSDSAYYKTYSRLLTNNELLQGLRDRGWRIHFLLHPTLDKQLEDFAAAVNVDPLAREMVDVVSPSTEGMSTSLRRSSILITDYSGIQFDFTYMRKPVVYYHPEGLPPTYGTTVFDPVRDGLGPSETTLDGLRSSVFHIIDNEGKPDPQYAARVESFFPFHDDRNSERIYQELCRDYDIE